MAATVLATTFMAVFNGCNTSTPHPESTPAAFLAITINARGDEPTMEVSIGLRPFPTVEPEINQLAQNLANARSVCSKRLELPGEEVFAINLKLSDGVVTKAPASPKKASPWTTCFKESLAGNRLIQNDKGVRQADLEIVLVPNQSPPTP